MSHISYVPPSKAFERTKRQKNHSLEDQTSSVPKCCADCGDGGPIRNDGSCPGVTKRACWSTMLIGKTSRGTSSSSDLECVPSAPGGNIEILQTGHRWSYCHPGKISTTHDNPITCPQGSAFAATC